MIRKVIHEYLEGKKWDMEVTFKSKGNLSTSKFRDQNGYQKKRQIKLKCLLKEVEAKGVKSNYFNCDLLKL